MIMSHTLAKTGRRVVFDSEDVDADDDDGDMDESATSVRSRSSHDSSRSSSRGIRGGSRDSEDLWRTTMAAAATWTRLPPWYVVVGSQTTSSSHGSRGGSRGSRSSRTTNRSHRTTKSSRVLVVIPASGRVSPLTQWSVSAHLTLMTTR